MSSTYGKILDVETGKSLGEYTARSSLVHPFITITHLCILRTMLLRSRNARRASNQGKLCECKNFIRQSKHLTIKIFLSRDLKL